MYDTCRKCNRELQDEESMERGFGPECWASIEKKTWKYVYSGVIVPDYQQRNWKLVDGTRWQLDVMEHVEKIGVKNDADFVMVNMLGNSALRGHTGFDEMVYFAKVSNGEGSEWGGVVPKEKWTYGGNVNPMSPMYSYAPVFILGEGNMVAIAAGTLEREPNGKGLNLLWVSKMQECRYNVPLFVHPFLAEIVPDFEIAYEPIPAVDSCQLENDQELGFAFADYINDSHAGLTLEEITGVPTEKRLGGDPFYRVAKLLAKSDTVWGRQCQGMIVDMESELVDEYNAEVCSLGTETAEFDSFVDICVDALNDQLVESMRYQEAYMHQDIAEHTFEE